MCSLPWTNVCSPNRLIPSFSICSWHKCNCCLHLIFIFVELENIAEGGIEDFVEKIWSLSLAIYHFTMPLKIFHPLQCEQWDAVCTGDSGAGYCRNFYVISKSFLNYFLLHIWTDESQFTFDRICFFSLVISTTCNWNVYHSFCGV